MKGHRGASVVVRPRCVGRTARGLRKEGVDALVEESGAAKARAQRSAETLSSTEQVAASGAISNEELDRARPQA